MARFQSKPKIITAIKLDPDQLEAIPAHVFRDKDGDWAVYNKLHDSNIKLKVGDYIRVDDPNDTYPIDADYMAANYDELPDEGEAAFAAVHDMLN